MIAQVQHHAPPRGTSCISQPQPRALRFASEERRRMPDSKAPHSQRRSPGRTEFFDALLRGRIQNRRDGAGRDCFVSSTWLESRRVASGGIVWLIGRMASPLRIRADNVVLQPDGSFHLVEAMFSATTDLTGPAPLLASRLHPIKAEAFLTLLQPSGKATPLGQATPVRVSEVGLSVNGPKGTVVRSFSEIADCSRALVSTGSCSGVTATFGLQGFDPSAEPILRQLEDGTSLLVFAALPPLITESDVAKAARFDLDSFGNEVIRTVPAGCVWEDREVFVIRAPPSQVLDALQRFLAGYWTSAVPTTSKQPALRKRGWWTRLLGG